MLLRNMDHAHGLANGTRMTIEQLGQWSILAKIATGPGKGTCILLPRITLTPSDSQRIPFRFSRRQFPIRPAWAMTINKAQGQTLRRVGIYLPEPCFAHGQLYVAASRACSRDDVLFYITHAQPDGAEGVSTTNVVHKDIFA